MLMCSDADMSVDNRVRCIKVNNAHPSFCITRTAPVTTVDSSDTGTDDTVVRKHCCLHHKMIQVPICPVGIKVNLHQCR